MREVTLEGKREEIDGIEQTLGVLAGEVVSYCSVLGAMAIWKACARRSCSCASKLITRCGSRQDGNWDAGPT
jgi:hypothetical protein